MTLAGAWGAWCIAISLAFVWPQVFRCVRHDTTHGISAFGTLHAISGSALWFTYGLVEYNLSMWFSNASFITAQVIISSVLLRHRRLPARLVASFALAEAVLLCAGLFAPHGNLGPNVVLGWVAIFVSGSGMVPNVIHVHRAHSLHGISISSWALTIVSASSWTAYGWIIGDPVITYVNYFTIPLMIYVIVKAWRWRVANGMPVFAAAAG